MAITEEIISELEARSVGITQYKVTEKKILKKKKHEQGPQGYEKIPNGLRVVTSECRMERRKGTGQKKNIFEEITAENIPNLAKRHQFTVSKISANQTGHTMIMIMLLKSNNQKI